MKKILALILLGVTLHSGCGIVSSSTSSSSGTSAPTLPSSYSIEIPTMNNTYAETLVSTGEALFNTNVQVGMTLFGYFSGSASSSGNTYVWTTTRNATVGLTLTATPITTTNYRWELVANGTGTIDSYFASATYTDQAIMTATINTTVANAGEILINNLYSSQWTASGADNYQAIYEDLGVYYYWFNKTSITDGSLQYVDEITTANNVSLDWHSSGATGVYTPGGSGSSVVWP